MTFAQALAFLADETNWDDCGGDTDAIQIPEAEINITRAKRYDPPEYDVYRWGCASTLTQDVNQAAQELARLTSEERT